MIGIMRDFVQNGGTYMVLGGEDGIPSQELNTVQTGMIAASTIPHFLPLRIKEIDFKAVLQYDITGKKMLEHMLRGEKLSMTEYYGLLLQIASVLDDCKLYMLQPERFILHEEYIFVEGPLQLGTLYLTYVPVYAVEGLKPLQDTLKDLITRLMASISELRGDGVQRLLQFVGGEHFSIPAFKRLLLDLMTNDDREGTAVSASVSARVPVPPSEARIHREEAGLPFRRNSGVEQMGDAALNGRNRSRVHEPIIEQNLTNGGRRGRPDRVPKEEDMTVDHAAGMSFNGLFSGWNKEQPGADAEPDHFMDDGEEEEEKSAKPIRTYIALGCLLAAALTWKMLFMSNPSSGMLILSCLLTAGLAVVAWLGWTGKLKLGQQKREAAEDEQPPMESVELHMSLGGRSKKKQPRFQVERLTGLFGSAKDGRGGHDVSEQMEDEPDWKWKFPKQDESQARRDHGLQGMASSQQPRNDLLFGSESDVVANRNQKIWEAAFSDSHYHEGRENLNSELYPDENDYYRELGSSTQMLHSAAGNATVLLSPRSDLEIPSGVGAQRPSYYLERREQGEAHSQRIELNAQHFVIGRSDEVSQFIEKTSGTSRAHVELTRDKDGGYVIKDLGSKNGTLLLGEPMVPYKEYRLQEGDTFVIIRGTYTFHAS